MARTIMDRLKGFLGLTGAPVYGVGELGGSYPFPILGDGWQNNIAGRYSPPVAAMQASISAYVHAFELMPATHRRELGDCGGSMPVSTSACARWLRAPNGFQTPAEFWGMGIRALFEKGAAVAALARNDRNEITAAIWVSYFSYTIIDGELFYYVTYSGTPGDLPDAMLPARDVLHLRINSTPEDPLKGRSPVLWCASTMTINAHLSEFLRHFLANRASPAYVLTTDLPLTKDAIDILRASWEEQSARMAAGGTPILSNGLKPAAFGVAPGDDLLVDTFNLTVEDIARAFSIPKALIGIAETASNAEQLMRAWVSLGLGSVIESVEQSIARAFRLPASEWLQFDHNALLRLDAAAQMATVKEGVTGGILSADEGRAYLGLPPVPGGFGRLPTMQQQQIPLDLLHALHEVTIAGKMPQASAQADPGNPTPPVGMPPHQGDPMHADPGGGTNPQGPQAAQRSADLSELIALAKVFLEREQTLQDVNQGLQAEPDVSVLRSTVEDMLLLKRAAA